VVQVEAEQVQQVERIQPELAVVIDSELAAQQAGEPASSHNSLAYVDADSGQGSKPLQSAKTELVQVAAIGVIQQSQIEPVTDTAPVSRIDEESLEQPNPSVPVVKPLATELTALTDFDAENQNLPESISDIESTVYAEEIANQQSELAALEPESLETELTQIAESLIDDQSFDEMAVPAESVMQVEAEHEQQIEQIQSELTFITGSGKETQYPGSLLSAHEESNQISRNLQPVTTQLAQVAAVGDIQQSLIEPVTDTEPVARIDEDSVDQSQPAVPVLKTVVTDVAALTDLNSKIQNLSESANDIELEADVGELFGPEPTLIETDAKQVAESLTDDQRFDEQFLPADTQLDRPPEVDVAQQNHIEPISDAELAEAAESGTNDEGLGGPITDYEQALQVDQQPNQQSQPDVTVLEPVSGEEKLVPTGEAEPVILLSTDLESLANAPVVLTESNVRPGDTLSSIFSRNNLSYKIALRLISAPGSKPISVLYPRDHLKFVWSNNKLLGIELRRKNKLTLMATYDGSQFSVINIREARRAGTIVKLLKQEIETVEREDLIDYETQYAKLKSTNLKWSTTTVKKGDALSKIFRRTGLSAVEAIAVAGYPGNEWLATGLKPGQVMNIAKSEEGKFAILEVPEKGTAKVRLVFPVEGGYFVGFKKIKAEVQEHYACAEVNSSLYSAGYAINIPREVLDEFVSLFESRFDFSRQLQRGDQFCIIYDREYIKGKPLKEINIKAGTLIQEDAQLRAFRHVDDDDKVAYYDSEGLNMQGHFLRSPIKSARVVSKYSKRRYHPVLKTNRPHLGVDYGARTGTPIRSTATGQIIKRGWSGGYGKMIVIQHGSKYRTLYAHMSRYADGTSVGSYVKQGQVIGYVGSTGLSTGPHLHYEFHVNGRHRDPLQYDMPKGQPIPEQYKIAFQAVVNEFSKRLASIDAPQVEYRPSTHQTASSQ
ncbi:MAG: peptidoglycan DD-metalloendopeptidase family protein, partial [Gammaproteobacteria bacterium]|nr:peptidoglycan DD-metalloendopeptidase family protein [Gammaproteobacteria bacterium]